MIYFARLRINSNNTIKCSCGYERTKLFLSLSPPPTATPTPFPIPVDVKVLLRSDRYGTLIAYMSAGNASNDWKLYGTNDNTDDLAHFTIEAAGSNENSETLYTIKTHHGRYIRALLTTEISEDSNYLVDQSEVIEDCTKFTIPIHHFSRNGRYEALFKTCYGTFLRLDQNSEVFHYASWGHGSGGNFVSASGTAFSILRV